MLNEIFHLVCIYHLREIACLQLKDTVIIIIKSSALSSIQ